MGQTGNYLSATRHPWSCLLFVLPLLAIYEVGLHFLGAGAAETLRNGADAWFRVGLAAVGMRDWFWAPALIAALLVLWSIYRRQDRPDDFIGTWVGMTVESIFFAVCLWAISKGLHPFLEGMGARLNSPGPAGTSGQIISFIGAGIYEETLFRLVLFSGLLWFLNLTDLPWVLTGLLAVLGSALLFAGAHHFGPTGEAYSSHVFAFRTLAGVYFTVLYLFRGLGIAIGAHAGYDVLVGVLVVNS
jgi:membrane protease YdiL (CAAX protease family)